MIRLTRIVSDRRGQPGRIVTSGELVLDAEDTHESWAQVCRAARAAGLAPPEIDPQTHEFVFRYLPHAQELWNTNVQTQIDNRQRALEHAKRAEDNLLRLGVERGADGQYALPLMGERFPTQTAPAPAPPASPPPATVADTPPPSSAEAPAPRLRLELVTEDQAIAIAAVMAAARAAEPTEWFKLGVCALVLEGREVALALEGLPDKAIARLKSMSEQTARELALKWAAEAIR